MLLLTGVSVAHVFFEDNFNDMAKWVHTSNSKFDGKFELAASKFAADPANKGLKTAQDAKFYAASAPIEPSFSNEDKELVVQFSVAHPQNIDCGGGYLKLLPKLDAAKFEGDSEYNIMFGPDICGYTKKIHLIFSHGGKNHLWKKEPVCESDQLTHMYTLHLKTDQTYAVYVDGVKKESGNLADDWDILKPKTIDDPNDKKPSDWEDNAEIDDPADKKPEDWDKEPETIADPDAKKPDDWNEDEDGTWEAPTIPNPKHKGSWKPKKIPNPKYKGVWAPKKIANPEYKEDPNLGKYADFSAVGFDLWQVKAGTIFDDILITDTLATADAARSAWEKSKDVEKKNKEAADAAESKASSSASASSDEKKEDKKDDDDDDEEL